ncbi:hypothetical protein [Kutzneria buriramensis]|uniref:Uncharacterized protein n=1 Tax=Kutzneria buriramensis TaxID=1045776 RepID=A0A3E0G7U9_9PSEU|nr:hypothetical protein [Kutzneria buriramensis]REH18046.1 hypothetical protein BCF44_13833 [Kutzneria buriramensis]
MLTSGTFPKAGFTAPRTTCFTTGRAAVISPPVVFLFAIEAALLLALVAYGVDVRLAACLTGGLVVVTAAAAVGGAGALPALRVIGHRTGAGALW